MIDTNVSLSRWPFRRLSGDDPEDLVARLRRHGVTQAWAGSFDGLLHRDIGAVNARLAEDCRRHGRDFLVPFGSVNPALPDWQEDLRRCQEIHHMPGIRLHPNYHGYTLRDPVFRDLLQMAARRGLIVQIAAAMEDDRMQHPAMRIPPVDTAPLAAVPKSKVMLLNVNLRQIAAAGPVSCDIAMVEGAGGVARLSPQRAVFGSNSPLFYFESAALKVHEAGWGEAQVRALHLDNARALLPAR